MNGMEPELLEGRAESEEKKMSKETEIVGENVSEIAVEPSLRERMKKVCGWVAKMSHTTKTFVVVFGIFAIIFGVFTVFKGLFIAVTVNGSSISRLSVIQELEKQSGKDALNMMITKKLIAEEIKKEKIVVSDEEVNAEVKKTEDQVVAQGGTLEAALTGQGMTLAALKEQIRINKELEQVLKDKVIVSDDEVNQYLSQSSPTASSKVSTDEEKAQAREQITSQKFNQAASQWVSDLKDKAAITYYVQYP
jgi:uncharacterized protein YfeS